MRGVTYRPAGTLKPPLPVQPEQPVESGPVQEDQHRGELRRVRGRRRPRRAGQKGALGVESPIAHVVVARVAELPVFLFQGFQCSDDLDRSVTDHPVAPDQVRVHVGETDRQARQPPEGEQVEKDRAAANERLEIPSEARRIVLG